MKWTVLLLTLLISACNSQQSKLSSIGGIGSSTSFTAPYITSVSVPPNNLYTIGQTLNFSFKFSKVVEVQGTPRLALQSENAVRYADYISGSGSDTLQFSYTIADGISDDNGITLSLAIDLNGGSIFEPIDNEDARLTYSAPQTWGILINASTATLQSITPPANGLYGAGSTLRFIANFSERVCGTNIPRIQLTIGGNVRYASRVNESCATTMKFDYVVQAGEIDSDGIQLTNVSVDLALGPAAIRDSFNDPAILNYNPATYASVLVGSVPPVEQPRTPPADDVYAIGEDIEFKLNYNKNVFVTGGTPTININVGGSSKQAPLYSGDGTQQLTFRYTVAEGDLDGDGIAVTGIQFNGSSIKDADNNNAPQTQSWPSLSNVKVDGVRPTITSVTPPAAGIYRPGGYLDFAVNWSEHVNFSATLPYLQFTIDSDATNKQAASQSNNGLVTTYRYSLQNGDADFNGIVLPSAQLTLPVGATITDDAGNTSASPVTFGALSTSGILVAPIGVDSWYDPSNIATYGTSAGSVLTQFKDMIGSRNGTVNGPVAWTGTPKRVDINNISQSLSFPLFGSFNKVYIVMETRGGAPGTIVSDANGGLVYMELWNGKITTYSVCGNCAKYFNGTIWKNSTIGTGDFGTYSGVAGQKFILMMDYQGVTNVEMHLGEGGFNGYIYDVFFLSGADSTIYAPQFFRALQMKHSGAIAP